MTLDLFEGIIGRLVASSGTGGALPLVDLEGLLGGDDEIAALAAAFLVCVAGPDQPAHREALRVFSRPATPPLDELARFLSGAVDTVREEVRRVAAADARVARALEEAAAALGAPDLDAHGAAEAAWTVFFPHGTGIRGRVEARREELRAHRTVTIGSPNADPITDPAREVLFTSNVLLTVPSDSTELGALPYPPDLLEAVRTATREPQRQWFDHPVQIGVGPAENEVLYGLRGLDAALAFEDARRPAGEPVGTVPCVLSVTVTHDGLRPVARPYVEAELARAEPLRHLAVHVFTETDTERLIDEVLVPARPGPGTREALCAVFGVDGAYGRHYSFLKAVAALWHVLVEPEVRATFKTDLDQVFPQAELLAETGRTAFGHLANPTWGAHGTDAHGRPVELGMLAGSLVNERDIAAGLFTPDVTFPAAPPEMDEHVFFSRLPQALSTSAEMLERHDSDARDGTTRALERVHVTGGTNGILVDALRRYRPFTPSFVGRAEDQAYVLSVLGKPGPRLAYAHAAGLVMRHDKEAFAGEAIAAAHVGKLVGDYVRILEFSAYAEVAAGSGEDGSLDLDGMHDLIGPFTGSFVSRLPITVTLLRFALRILRFHRDGEHATARSFALVGARRIAEAIERTHPVDRMRAVIDRERLGWDAYYDALDALEQGLSAGDPGALELRDRARTIVAGCRVG